MVRSLVAIGAVVALLYFMVPRSRQPYQPRVDVADTMAVAAAAMGTQERPAQLRVPSLTDGWTPNGTSWSPVQSFPTLHVGYLTPSKQYAALEMTVNGSDRWLAEVTLDGRQVGTLPVSGRTWDVWQTLDEKRTALVLRRPASSIGAKSPSAEPATVLTVVTGTASRAELVTLATAVVAG